MKELNKRDANKLIRFNKFYTHIDFDHRDYPALWEVKYEKAGTGYNKDYFLTNDHRTTPTFNDIPESGVLSIESIKQVSVAGPSYSDWVYDLRK